MLSLRIPLRLAIRVGQAPTRVARPSIGPPRSHQPSLALSRSYASPGRPKKSDSEQTSFDASPKRKRSTTPKKTAAEPKKTTTKPKKAATKPRKNAAKKPALTPEQQALKKEKDAAKRERSMARATKLEIKELKEKALSPPNKHKLNAWVVFHAEKSKGLNLPRQGGTDIASHTKESVEEWKNLDSRQREHYNHITNERNREAVEAYQQWLSSLTPEQVRQANQARRRLHHLGVGYARKYALIKDDRLVKRPVSSYLIYSTERRNTGDYRGVSLTQASKDIGEEWKAMSASEKKNYEDLAVDAKKRYREEYTEVYGHPPTHVNAAKTSS